MYYKQELGQTGEKIATKYLLENNYRIVGRNFRTRLGEIDIIAIDKDELVFIEVKTRTTDKYGKPSEAVDYEKIKHILRVAEYYMYIYKIKNTYCRIDVIEVIINKEQYYINHIKQCV